jgi:DNA-binding CsgD family transcriptional regulator/tetratricopeptide (TPR) repeat protein
MAFMGRERELAQLAGTLERGAEGATSRVVLAGPAGVGITRLLDELESRIVDLPGVVVARGRADAPTAGLAYHSLSDALGSALAKVPDHQLPTIVGPAGHDMFALIPDLGARLDLLGIDHALQAAQAPEQRGSRVAEGVLGVLERLADGGLVLLALEDLHWADPATRAFVASLLRVGRPLPLCLLLTYQPEELHRRHPARELARSLNEDPRVEMLTVAPLARDDLAHLVESEIGEAPSGSLVAAVMEGSRGNPLLAIQLIIAATTLEGLRLSDPFEQILGARLDSLSADGVRVVRLLAAARGPVPRPVLLAARPSEGRITAKGLADAIDSRLVVEVGDSVGITHELYAEAIEELELPPERHQLHIALAKAAHDTPAVAAWHWEAASHPAEARTAHLAAAAASQGIDPGETTLLHFQQALELGADEEAAISGPAIAELLSSAARAAATAGQFRRAAAFMRRAVDQRVSRRSGVESKARDAGLQRDLGAMHVELGRYLWTGGDLVAGVEAMERALALMPNEPSQPRARALASLAQHLMIDGRFDESARLAQEARSVAREAGDVARPELGHATCTLGVDVAYLGELDRGLALLEEATEIARAEGRLDDLMRAHANRTTLLDLDSRREAALAVVKDGIRDARAGGLSATYGAFLRGNAADILFQLGRWREAEYECRAAMEWPPSGVAWFSPTLYLALLLVEARGGEEAARLVGQTLLQLEAVPAGQWTALVLRAAVSLALWRGDAAGAMSVAEHGWERVLETDDPGQIALAASTSLEAAAAVSEESRSRRDWAGVAAAAQLAQRVLPEAELRLAGSSLPPSLGARREAELHLDVARAHLARLRGRASARDWDRVAQAWAEIPVPYKEAKARWWQALAILQASGSRPEARDALLEAWRIAGDLPAWPLQAAVLDLAVRARIPLPGQERFSAQLETWRLAEARAAQTRASGQVLVPVGAGRADEARTATGRAIAERLRVAEGGTGEDRFGLSPREQEVLSVLIDGRTNREIAERLFISDRTVAVHVRRILSKLKVSGRVEAAGMAIRLGLVPDHPSHRPVSGDAGQRTPIAPG